jgi:mannose-6-phosphate isomerase-like protein (cupin superfamily)
LDLEVLRQELIADISSIPQSLVLHRQSSGEWFGKADRETHRGPVDPPRATKPAYPTAKVSNRMSKQVNNIPVAAEDELIWGPMRLDNRYKQSNLTTVEPNVFSFSDDRQSDKITMAVDEALYITAGRLTITVEGDGDDDYSVTGEQGDVLTIKKGATVRYQGTGGTRGFLCVGASD